MKDVEAYRRETQRIINRFFDRRLTFDQCMAAINAASTDFARTVPQNQLVSLRIMISANIEIVRKERERQTIPVRNAQPLSASGRAGD